MRICELILKNFGKFTGRSISLSDGIHILYGENESGKSTVHTFIKGMLFGLERGRGRASVNDTFSRYEPWENPNYYAGVLRFEVGGKHFVIDRNFDRYAKKVSVICEEDGEELSVEAGDLEVLLDGLTPLRYDNTISVAQMKSATGVSLSAELKNYATNYYVTGDSDLDLEGALAKLQDKKKEVERQIREAMQEKQACREKIELEASYVWRDVHRLEEEEERLEAEISHREMTKEPQEEKSVIDELRPAKWRVHPVEILLFIAIVITSAVVIPKPFSYFAVIVLSLCCGIYVWNRMKVGKKVEKTESERLLEEITPEEEKIPLSRLIWEKEHTEEELHDKQVQYHNLRERLEEMDEVTAEFREYEHKKSALQLAIDRIQELSMDMQKRLQADLNTRASQIIAEITGGKYEKLIVEKDLSMSLLSGGRKIAIEQVSQGTVEQVYFAFRMAAGELLNGEELPVILDDTFVCYDDERLANTLQWLYRHKKQVLLFTCQRREEEALEKLHIPYSKEII